MERFQTETKVAIDECRSSACLFQEIFTDYTGRDTKPPKAYIEIGQIHQIGLPAGWVEGESSSGVLGNSDYRQFHHPDNPDVQIAFSFRGHKTSPTAAEVFKRTLNSSPHNLSKEEITDLSETIARISDPSEFVIKRAATTVLNDKTVLAIEGQYKARTISERVIYVDADGTGSTVQEVSYTAPTALYHANLNTATASMNSIMWKR